MKKELKELEQYKVRTNLPLYRDRLTSPSPHGMPAPPRMTC